MFTKTSSTDEANRIAYFQSRREVMQICNPSLLECKRPVLLLRRGGGDLSGERPSRRGGDHGEEQSERCGGARRSFGDRRRRGRESRGGADAPGRHWEQRRARRDEL
jgi:hypothetical protein